MKNNTKELTSPSRREFMSTAAIAAGGGCSAWHGAWIDRSTSPANGQERPKG